MISRRGRIETNLLRAPVWDANSGMRPDPAPISVLSLLGGDRRVKASRRLSMRDLAVLAAAGERLVSVAAPETDAPMTLYQLAEQVYGASGGEQRGIARPKQPGREPTGVLASLDRLVEISLEIPGYDVTRGRVVGDLAGRSKANLLEAVFVEHDRLELVSAAERGSLRGTVNVRVRFSRWYSEQIRAGYCTYLDLVQFRRLGSGAAARVWAYLEAESYEPKADGLETKVIGLGPKIIATLDLAGYERPRDAIRALRRASARGDARRRALRARRSPPGDLRPGSLRCASHGPAPRPGARPRCRA